MGVKGFEKLSLVDYDNKLSAVIFFGGCNFRCPFCHNYDLVINPNKEEDIPFDTILSYLKKRVGVLDAVVFTGGEPTLFNVLKPMIEEVKMLGYLVKIDSNGTNPEVLKELIDEGLIDFIAMDIKNSFNKYDETSGVKVNHNNIKASIELIMNSGVDYEFRTTIINEYHDQEDMLEIAKMIKGAKKYRLQKFTDHGTCINDNLHEVDIKKAQEFVEILKPYISNTELRGYDD